MKTLVKSKIDIFFVFGKKNRLFNLSLPVVIIWAIVGGVLVILITFTLILFDYSNHIIDQKSLSSLKRENITLKNELKKYENLTEELRLSIADLQKYDAKLRIYSGLEPLNKDLRQMGVGGFPTDSMLLNINRDVREQVINLNLSLQQLVAEARLQRQSYEDIAKHLKEKELLRTHTPSIPPVNGWWMSGFGMRIDPFTGYLKMHTGLDIAAPSGTPIVAPADGTVESIEYKEGYGLTVEINHGYGIKTYYAHCLTSLCQVGQKIKRGDLIATVGESGRTTGPHLHYEVRLGDNPVDPEDYIIKEVSIVD